ncbi:MAG: methyl-accepting chemotaxis protein [Granulosicoccus sp.]
MRVNGPVIDQEYQFPSGETLVSTTDLKGRILYCNGPFVVVSGFEKSQLLGQPHNMIRHPDMPEEAFRDMWETISKGQPWSAPVKNRRADGTHYWVIANVTPLLDANGPTGYMSVRTEASRAQIDAAEALYATMRQEAQNGKLNHRLFAGDVQTNSLFSRIRRIMMPGLGRLLFLVSACMCAVTFFAGAYASSLLEGRALWAVAISATALAAFIGSFIVKRLTIDRVQELLSQVNRMSAGDLTVQLPKGRNDILGRLTQGLNQLNVNLRSIVRDARNEAEVMQHVSGEIATSNQDLAVRTDSQASGLEETAAAMEQITSTVSQSASAAQEAAELAGLAKSVADRSGEEVRQVALNMSSINDSSNQIGEIIQVIDTIAFQTNILALNAAVEAARAGEQGRGFAVVASEVRELAKRTSTAAQQVKDLVTESSARVSAGSSQTDAAQKAMEEALLAVTQVSELIQGISHSATEQRQGISEINLTITQLDTMTQQNSSLVEKNAVNSMQMKEKSDAVLESVGIFHLSAGEVSRPKVDAVELRRQGKAQRKAA